jgi:hypothetical protein
VACCAQRRRSRQSSVSISCRKILVTAATALGRKCHDELLRAPRADRAGESEAEQPAREIPAGEPGAWQSTCAHVHYAREGPGAPPGRTREQAGRSATAAAAAPRQCHETNRPVPTGR